MTGAGARTLVLLRHAKAGARDAPDHERELAAAGRAQAPLVAGRLRAQGWSPQVVLCSTATRTRQTWELVAGELPEPTTDVRYLDVLYGADLGDVLAEIGEVPDEITDVLVVGHEPTMSATAAHLAGPDSDPSALALVRVGVPTAALSFLETEARWSELRRGAATLTAVLTSPH
ncbi:SixA phosphatase family protein [Pseudactinotalea suaedae]|uniref:SixA phosphatase family protein n=1 Tax=Pseudactinotalea suaedae TaxID=1524924 RepID=UPI0012E2542A|nr:histidine phosphatase family protein [Pseudactinotalea suaedae]